MASESQVKASVKYDRENTVMVPLKLNRKTDADILEWLSHCDNRQGAIKRLIRWEIDRERYMKP